MEIKDIKLIESIDMGGYSNVYYSITIDGIKKDMLNIGKNWYKLKIVKEYVREFEDVEDALNEILKK